MQDRIIKISEKLHKYVKEEAMAHGLTLKSYTESSLQFFYTRKLNPTKYQAGQEYQLSRDVNKAVDRIFSFMVQQEKNVLKHIITEVVRSRILIDIMIHNLHHLYSGDPEVIEKLCESNEKYMQESAKNILAKYFQK